VDLIEKYHYDSYLTIIKDMDDCFKSKHHPTILTNPNKGKETYLYKGTMLPNNLVNKKTGDELCFDEYLSTTLEPQTAIKFLNMVPTSDNLIQPVLFIISGYESNPYIHLDWPAVKLLEMKKIKLGPGNDEYEILLPRGCKFRILKKYKTQDFSKYYDADAIALQRVSEFYSDIGDIDSNFLSRRSVKSVLNKPVELTVMEIEYKGRVNKPIIPIHATDPGVLTTMELFLGDIAGATKKSRTIKSIKSGSVKATISKIAIVKIAPQKLINCIEIIYQNIILYYHIFIIRNLFFPFLVQIDSIRQK